MKIYHIYSHSDFLRELHHRCDEFLTKPEWIYQSILSLNDTSDIVIFHCCWAYLFYEIQSQFPPVEPYIIVKEIFDDYDDEMM